ncbi:hypothetical protein PF004_g749 [Phytophthora fragariae]|uniref:Uncharacterized protein n=1 Tax=Phytophthora fragariae TaxID=53985 RepID=A0A6G0PUS8_9STRA|nr:hypothetical protein PF004_g749 [Phytophthora fragariae]
MGNFFGVMNAAWTHDTNAGIITSFVTSVRHSEYIQLEILAISTVIAEIFAAVLSKDTEE